MLVVPEKRRSELLGHARTNAPHECCGVLGGQLGDQMTVETIQQIENTAPDPAVRYQMDPEALMTTIDRIETAGHELLGFYHSHPDGPSQPSATDRKEARWRDYLYVIISLTDNPTITAWNWTGSEFRSVPVMIVD